MFTPAATRTGALDVRWEPPASPLSEARMWLLLGDPADLTPDDLHPERLLRHLIRLPVASAAGGCVVHAPVARPLGLALVGRDRDDAPVTVPLTAVAEASPSPESTPTTPNSRGVARSEFPGIGIRMTDSLPLGPFVTTPAATAPDVAALAARLLASGPRPPTEATPGGFGVTASWTLARLAFPRTRDAARLLVRRQTFIPGSDVAAWRETPPTDALRLPADCDGLVDGLAEDGRTTFYVVLASADGGAPWRPLPLSPVPPPFETCVAPVVLGPARARLEAAFATDAPASLHELRDAALRSLA